MSTASLPASSAAAKPGGSGTAAQLAFLLLFPGFFFYQTLIGLGVMSAFLGGYFGLVSIAMSVPLVFSYVRAVRAAQYRMARTDLQFGAFLVYFLVVVAINAAFGANAAIDKHHLASILYSFNIYVIFKTVDFADARMKCAAWVCLLLMTGIIFYYSTDGIFRPGQVGDAHSPESVASYQGFARSYVLTFVPVIAYTRWAPARLALYVVALLALYMNSSRSELVAVLMLIPLVEIYRAKSGLPVLWLCLAGIAALVASTQITEEALPESRVWELFNLSQSESAQTRHQLLEHALRSIADYPLMGDYANYLPGGYAHNILSAWVDLGIFGFAYMLFLLLPKAFELCVGSLRRRPASGSLLLAWSMICVALLLLVTAKTFDDMCAGAALGAYAHYRSSKAAAGSKDASGAG